MIELDLPGSDNPILQIIREVAPWLDIDYGPWVAGGAVRRLADNETDISISDVDIFFPNVSLYGWACEYIQQRKDHLHLPYKYLERQETPASTIFTLTKNLKHYKFQLIKKAFYENAEELFDSFDFTITMFATDGRTMVADDRAPGDLSKRRLVIHHKYDKPKAARFAKYCAQGFHPTAGVVADAFAINTNWQFVSTSLTLDEY